MAETSLSYTVKVESSKEDHELLFNVFQKMVDDDFGEVMKCDADDEQKTFDVEQEGGSADAILHALKTCNLLDAAGYARVPFKIYGVENMDYGMRAVFLIDCTITPPTYQQAVFDLSEMGEDEAMDWDDDYSGDYPLGRDRIDSVLVEQGISPEPLETASPLKYLITPVETQLQTFRDEIPDYLDLFE